MAWAGPGRPSPPTRPGDGLPTRPARGSCRGKPGSAPSPRAEDSREAWGPREGSAARGRRRPGAPSRQRRGGNGDLAPAPPDRGRWRLRAATGRGGRSGDTRGRGAGTLHPGRSSPAAQTHGHDAKPLGAAARRAGPAPPRAGRAQPHGTRSKHPTTAPPRPLRSPEA